MGGPVSSEAVDLTLELPPSPEDLFLESFLAELHERIPTSKDELQQLKRRIARSHGVSGIPSDSDVLGRLPRPIRDELVDLLRVKPARTASGVAVVTVMTAPHACPHGVCTFCPGGPKFGTPQSYVGTEPAARRASAHGYDPGAQLVARLRSLEEIGHPTDKVDLIVLGGTFTALDRGYQEWFVKGCLDAMNGFVSDSIGAAQAANETAAARCIGLTIETKPDCFLGSEVEACLALGTTRVELGIQSTHDDVLEAVHRGHTDAQSRAAFRAAKAAGLKVGAHMMPGLPGSDCDRDLESFRTLFDDSDYRPDFLKIYPTLVLPVKALVPRWCRIQRVQREIGAPEIQGGPKKGDLRVLARERLLEVGLRCVCVRCREVGFRGVGPRPAALTMLRSEYESSGGIEIFLSIEDSGLDVLVAYARLRIDQARATVRELKVFGPMVRIHEASNDRWQHRGFGRRLMDECERLARDEFDARAVRVTAGVGVRGYYRTLGYDLRTPYMVKTL